MYTMKKWRNVKMAKLMLLIPGMIFMLISLLFLGNTPVWASVVYSYEDTPSTVKLAEGYPYVSGNHMVWTQKDESGYVQVFYQNVKTTVIQKITTFSSLKHSPKVSEDRDGKIYIIWTDARDYEAEKIWTMYGYELSAGKEWRLNAHPEYYLRLTMNGSEFVGNDNYTKNIVYYDLKTNKETLIGKGRSPEVGDGKVLFINETNGGLSMYTVSTGETKAVLELPYHLNVLELKFDGTVAFYKQGDLDLRTKYVVWKVTDPSAKPVDLTAATKKQDEYFQMYIGNGQLAWIQDQGGTPGLYGFNLQLGESYKITEGDKAFGGVGFAGNELVMKDTDGNFYFRRVVRTEVPDTVRNIQGVPLPQEDVVNKKIGTQGGDLISKDGSVKLHIPSGTVSQDTDMKLGLHTKQTAAISSTIKGAMRPVSKAWNIEVGSALMKNAQLTYVYDQKNWNNRQEQKMVVYRWDDLTKQWVLMNGRLDQAGGAVTAEISQSGIYALIENDVAFADGTEHWSQNYVEVLAARGIVDGIGENQFGPDQVLTRAQFTKMLLGALQIVPKSGSKDTFKDLKDGHWATGWVESAVEAGLVQGDGGDFHPDAELTREQMMAMLVRAIGDEQKAKTLTGEQLTQTLTYSDASEISEWAQPYAAISSQSGLIEGDQGNIRPKDSSTRAQAAAVIYRLLKNMQKI